MAHPVWGYWESKWIGKEGQRYVWRYPHMLHILRLFSHITVCYIWEAVVGCVSLVIKLIARFMRPTRGPSGADRTQVGPMLAPWTLLCGQLWQLTRDSIAPGYHVWPNPLCVLAIDTIKIQHREGWMEVIHLLAISYLTVLGFFDNGPGFTMTMNWENAIPLGSQTKLCSMIGMIYNIIDEICKSSAVKISLQCSLAPPVIFVTTSCIVSLLSGYGWPKIDSLMPRQNGCKFADDIF